MAKKKDKLDSKRQELIEHIAEQELHLPQSNSEDAGPPISKRRIWIFVLSVLFVFWFLFITNIYGAMNNKDDGSADFDDLYEDETSFKDT